MNNIQWWKEAIAYQVYPRSFKDSNKDGIGDLRGMIDKLDYIQSLGIDVIWICPMYKSPNDDNGYDISDYCDIMADFGTMADFDALLEAVHARGMKLIIDLVINHTSDEHEWFVASRASKDNPKRDWYIWRDGKDGEAPNNWESIFSGSAWQKDEATDQYFLHLFSTRQPDLNWENEAVRQALYEMINWWLDKGIDGFRVDAISHIKKEEGLLDMPNPDNAQYVACFDKMMNVPGIEPFIEELKMETFAKYDIMTVGEANGVTPETADAWVCEEKGAFNMIFQFSHLHLWEDGFDVTFNVKQYKTALQTWQDALYNKGWNALFIENHDQPRVVSKWGNTGEYLEASAKALGLSYFMQQGTPFIYQGQEIGMTNIVFETIDELNDVGTKNGYYKDLAHGVTSEASLERINKFSRDHSRTPMQWDTSAFGGFTEADTTWLKMNPNYKTLNVAVQEQDPDSVLNFYKAMIALKKSDKVFVTAPCQLVMPEDRSIYAYTREGEAYTYVVICNLTDEQAIYEDARYTLTSDTLVLSNEKDVVHAPTTTLTLKPWAARVYRVTNV